VAAGKKLMKTVLLFPAGNVFLFAGWLATGMLIALGLLVLAGDTVSGKLVGENVCQEEQRYMRDFSSTKIISSNFTYLKKNWKISSNIFYQPYFKLR
jgi:hypothetical protein